MSGVLLGRETGIRVVNRTRDRALGGRVYPVDNKSSGTAIFCYELETEWSTNPNVVRTATATILDSEGGELESGAEIRDPKEYMTDQVVGDEGHCYLEGGIYYAIQAPCTQNNTGNGTGTGPSVGPVSNSSSFSPTRGSV